LESQWSLLANSLKSGRRTKRSLTGKMKKMKTCRPLSSEQRKDQSSKRRMRLLVVMIRMPQLASLGANLELSVNSAKIK